MKRKITPLLCIVFITCFTLVTPAFALDESDVQTAIAASSAETVSGNIFIWFLCAIAFLKISQKIDSFMASLGVNVGRTGGSMLAELMIAGRAIGAAARATGGAIGGIFNHGRSSTTVNNQATAAGANFTGGSGIAGIAMRAAAPAAAANLTGRGSGLRNTVAGAVVNSSIQSGGEFGTGVVGAVAKGSISRDGSITGPRAAQALTSYLGYQMPGGGSTGGGIPTSGASDMPDPGTLSQEVVPPEAEDAVSLDGGAAAAAGIGMASGAEAPSEPLVGEPTASPSATEQINAGVQPISAQPPTFRDVEIGGGRITGYETPAGGGEERQFAMYSASQYMQPSGPYEVVQTADGESWYKQYAQPTVQKTPYVGEKGKIEFDEKIVTEMPQVPKRKDKI